MSQPSSEPDAVPDLDRPVELADLVEAGDLRALLRSATELYRVKVALCPLNGAILVAEGAGQPLCGLVTEGAEGASRCAAKLMEVHGPGAPASLARSLPESRAIDCFTGFRYLVAPIVYDGAPLGRLVFGPYRPVESSASLPGSVAGTVGDEDATRSAAERAFASARSLGDEDARRALDHLVAVLDLVLHQAHTRQLMSDVHLATVRQSYGELLETNQRLSQVVTRLTEADRLKSSFLATVSHELRTPLTSVIGYSEMLLEGLAGALSEEQRDYVRTIMEKGEQLLGLITGILDVSRIASGTVEVYREEVDLGEILLVAANTISGLARRKQLEVRTRIEEGLPRIHGDREKLRQVVLNLLGNAVKFTPEGGSVEATLVRASGGATPLSPPRPEGSEMDAIEIAVRDTGIGIPRELQERIFEPFYQVDSSSTREYGGTGLGLALVKSFTEAHGGAVWVDSEFGRGSIFHVWIPLTAGAKDGQVELIPLVGLDGARGA